jgi:dTDP-4-amino-4,6-dideoxygalactose transaminase/predicted dehydrogenase
MSPAKDVPGRKLFNAEELKMVHKALLSQNLFGIDGKMVPALEKEFARVYGAPYGVASTSGTAALHTAIGALDLNPGDEVITAPITDLGTIIPILYQNAVPVFADIDHTYNMDPADVERKITNRTKAIIAVHLFGNPCNMDEMVKVAKKHNIPLIEDCSQAHMTEYKGKFVGTLGDIGCYSFQQSKHMTTGDGGLTITANKAYYEKMKLFVDKGYARKGWGARAYLFLAPNYRMNELTAAVGLAQLKKVKDVVKKRNELGMYLTNLLTQIDPKNELIEFAPVTQGAKSSFWLYPLYLKNIDAETFAKEMLKERVWVGAGYTGKPIYLCSESLTAKKTFGNSGFPFSPKVTDKNYEYKEGLCPKAEEALKHLVTVPVDESWDRARVEHTAKTIKLCLERLTNKTIQVPIQETSKAEQPSVVSTTQKKIRVGIVGCGQMGRWHWSAYRRSPNAQMIAFADMDFDKADLFAREVNAKAYKTHQEMIAKEKLDAVSVCSVPVTHKGIVLDLLNAGIHVLCEKPLAMNVSEGEEMLAKANEKGLLLLPAQKFRFFDEVIAVKELLDKNVLGRILNFRVMFGGQLDMTGTWYAKRAISGGGIIMDNGPHAFDLIRHLFGEIEAISAQASQFQDIEVEDTALVTCSLKGGTQGTASLSWTIPLPSKTYLEIYGEEGTAVLDFHSLSYKLKTWDDWKHVPSPRDMKGAFDIQINHFVDAVAGKPATVVTNEDGLKIQQLIEAAYESLEQKDKVMVG